MALVTFPGTTRLYYPADLRMAAPEHIEHQLAAIPNWPEELVVGGRVWFKERTGTKVISRVGFYVQGWRWREIQSDGTALRVSLHDMADNFFGPEQAELAAAVIGSADLKNEWHSAGPFNSAISVSYGQKLCVMVSFYVYVANVVSLFSFETAGGGETRGFPWVATKQNNVSAYSFHGTLPNLVLEFSDGTFGMLDGSLPYLSAGSASLGSTEYNGLQFRLPWNCKIDALCAYAAPLGSQETETTSLVLLQGTTVLGETEFDEAEHTSSSTNRLLIAPLSEEVELAANTDYIVALRPNNNASAYLAVLGLQSAGHRACVGDLNIGQVTRANGGDPWSSLFPTAIPRLGVRISGAGLVAAIGLLTNSGSYTIGGSEAALKKGLKLAAASGSYAVTGFAADLRAPTHRLTADGGSYTYAGSAAALKRGRLIRPENGSYSYIGNAASLLYKRKLAAATGSYAITGSAADLRHGKGIALATGSYGVTGSPATLRRGFQLVAASGSYSVTGFAATPRTTRTMQEENGSYSYIGEPTVMTFGRRLFADGGDYTLTGFETTLAIEGTLTVENGSHSYLGEPATLTVGRKLLAADGSYTYTGSAAALSAGRYLLAASGSYAVTGSAAEFSIGGTLDCRRSSAVYVSSPWRSLLPRPDGTIGVTDRRKTAYYYCAEFGASLNVDAGSYTISGSDVTFRRTYFIQGENGSYSYIGFAADLLATRLLQMDSGFYGVTGSAAGLAAARQIAAASGGYNVEGAMAALAHGCRLAAESGSYDVTGSPAVTATGRRLAATAGEYDLTGGEAGLTAARLLSLVAGEYTWTGSAAGFRITRHLIAAGGSYGVTGSDAELIQFEPAWTSNFNYLVDDIFEP